MKALVVARGGGIGDVLLATPAIRALRSRYDAVVALTTPAHLAILVNNPDLAEVWASDGALGNDVARARAFGFDACVVTWATPRDALLPFLAGIPERVGQARRLYSPLFTKRVVVRSERGDRETHWTQILLDYARALDCDTPDPVPTFVVTAVAREAIARALAAARVAPSYVVLHPTRGISAIRDRWPTERFVALARALVARGFAVVVTGTNDDRPIAETIARDAGAVSFAGTTSIGEFAALARGARAVVAMDSGPMHLAAAVGAPTVGIFALQSDEPERWAPLGSRTAIVRATYPCPGDHRKETCPDFACVARIDIGRVLQKLDAVL